MGTSVVVVSGVLTLLAVAVAGLSAVERHRSRQTEAQLRESHELFMRQMDTIEDLLVGEEDESNDPPAAVITFSRPSETDYFSSHVLEYTCKHHYAEAAEKRWLGGIGSHGPRGRRVVVGHYHGKELVKREV